MKLSRFERISLINQFKILKKLNNNDKYEERYYNQAIRALELGISSQYEYFSGILEDEIEEDIQDFVVKVLDMYSNISSVYYELSDSDKEKINEVDIMYKGFTGEENREYLKVADFLINNMSLYEELQESIKDDAEISQKYYKNIVREYKAMIERYESVIKRREWNNQKIFALTVDDVLEIVR